MSSELDKSQYVLPLDQPIVSLEVASAFNGLTDKEKLYSHYISQASWTGGLITFLQTSPESGPIFVLLHKVFSSQNLKDLKNAAIKAGLTEDEVKAFLIYTCGVFSNAGNYKVINK
jgi:dipeptidyl-peptidase-3